MRSGTPLPDHIKNAPVLRPGLEIFLEGFMQLSGDRQMGFGLGPIPVSSILTYTRHLGLCPEVEEDFLHFIKEMDLEFLAYAKEEQELQKKQMTKSENNRRR